MLKYTSGAPEGYPRPHGGPPTKSSPSTRCERDEGKEGSALEGGSELTHEQPSLNSLRLKPTLASRACHCRATLRCLTCAAWLRLWRNLDARNAERRAAEADRRGAA